MEMTADSLDVLVNAAVAVRQRAYAPYSKFRVGAALRLKDGRTVVGANVENCSYGLCICAERSAVVAAVAQGLQPGDVIAIAVAADAAQMTAPCGACRQVLAEFAPLDAPVVLHNVRNNVRTQASVGELLPLAFTPATLAGAP